MIGSPLPIDLGERTLDPEVMSGPLSLLADLLRLPWALVAWNWRKMRYRAKGNLGRCPCQHPSDSGVAGETGCDACVDWNAPSRFQWVCPLLVPGEHGWHCSVHAEEVRPFWGRAALILLLATVTFHLVVTSAVTVTLNLSGLDTLRWIDVAWPGRWHQVAKARSRAFALQTAQLLQRGDFVAAELALVSALQVDPGNYEARLFLAQFRQYQKRYMESDALFGGLMRFSPERVGQTALAWHDALVIRQRFSQLANLSLGMGSEPGEMAAAWARSALLAVRLGNTAADTLMRNVEVVAKFPAPVRALFRAEEQRQQGAHRAALEQVLAGGAAPLVPFLVGEYVEQFLRLREPARAEAFLRQQEGMLDSFDRAMLQMRIDQASGDTALVRMDFEALLPAEMTPAVLWRLVAWLVEYPDLRSFARLDRVMRESKNQRALAGGEMWLVATVCGDTAAAEYWAKYVSTRFRLRLPAIKALDFISDDMTNVAAVPRIIAVGRLPREVIFALVRRSVEERSGKGPETVERQVP